MPARHLRQLLAPVRSDGVFWRRFAYLGCIYGPEWFKRLSPPVIGAIMFALLRRNRQTAMKNMRRVLAGQSPRALQTATLNMFADFARCFEEAMECSARHTGRLRIDRPERDPIAEALERGRGAVVVTGHFGSWEIAARTLSEYQSPINLVMVREPNTTAERFARAIRERTGIRVILCGSSAFSAFNMLSALRRNEIVAMQLDRGLGREAVRMVPFFGVPAPFPLGPFTLARVAQSPLIAAFAPRLGRLHYSVRLSRSFHIARHAGTNVIDEVMLEVVQQFETAVREFPTQWFQFAELWPSDSTTHGAETDTGSDQPLLGVASRG